MNIYLAMLWSDWLFYFMFLALIITMTWMCRRQPSRAKWLTVLRSRLGMMSCVILLAYVSIGLLDSVHFRIAYPQENSRFVSALDLLLGPVTLQQEETYSAPFALYSFSRTLIEGPNNKPTMIYPRLHYVSKDISNSPQRNHDVIVRIGRGLLYGMISFMVLFLLFTALLARGRWQLWRQRMGIMIRGKNEIAWGSGFITLLIVWLLVSVLAQLIFAYHVLGTDKVGNDVFYLSIKSIRTGLLIGTLTTVFMLPFALLLGTAAGYFRGWVDDVIQYAYTTLSSIPGVLLISAMVLVLDVYISRHDYLFPSLPQRADARLLMLCLILGITSWSNLCRLLRAETLKLRQLEFVQAARAFGVRQPMIIARHIIPNVMHIVIITLVLDFSGLVLTEAVLSYVGVGVDPTTLSWGNMINSSRLELAREPIVWWPLVAALVFMFALVLAANIFADAVRDAFDPRLNH